MSKDWSELTNFKPSAFSLELLKTLENAGLTSPVLRGGALRDMFLGRADKINDYDTCCHLGEDIAAELTGPDEQIADHYKMLLQSALPYTSDFSVIAVDRCGRNKDLFIGVEFKFQDRRVALVTDGRNEPFEVMALFGDAPINSIGMNAAGRTIAHPLFEDHARSHIYAPFQGIQPERISERFHHMAKKFEDLKLDAPLVRTVPTPKPFFS